MMRLVTSAIVFRASQAVAQQTSAECLADAPTMEASLLQSSFASERETAGGAAVDAPAGSGSLLQALVQDVAEGPGPLLQALVQDVAEGPAEIAAKVAAEAASEGAEEPAKAEKKAEKKAGKEDEADEAPAKKKPIVGDDAGITKIEPFGREDTATELQSHAAKTQDTLVDAVENAEVAEIKRSVFRALTRLRAAEIKEFDTIARLETQAIDEYNDDHHYRKENPLQYLNSGEGEVEADKYSSFHE